ncbi:VOC family protein [Microbacterium elymi]|uniref:VOC family protein n=1 Tax=Microbacterium elymi TaxID=2909587 RepID=A0ABY5NLZ7_9MICO|nr:VOC family protein [Microbacterium elymi]UUT36213.1 VOC family protein [Microbacterium elymi]
MAHPESFDLAHLGGIELFTPKFDESLHFFRDICAMREVARVGDSAYLRTWDEYQLYSLKLTASDTNGVGRTLFRTTSPDALDRRVAAIEAAGLGHGWREPEVGVGRSYEFEDPDGHLMGIYYDTELYVPDDEDRPALKNQASAYPGRGINARRLDHINYLAADVDAAGDFWQDVMHSRESERVRMDDGHFAARWFRFHQKSYDVVYSEDWTGERGRFHHFAFAPDSREDILKAADICLENGIYIEYGPYKHAINQTFFLYVWEPGGNRIEFANAQARLAAGPGLSDRAVEPGRARQGPGLGHEDRGHLPHARHAVRGEPGGDRPAGPRRALSAGSGCRSIDRHPDHRLQARQEVTRPMKNHRGEGAASVDPIGDGFHVPRRVVTGHDAQGVSVVVSDGPVPVTRALPDDGVAFHEVWATDAVPADIHAGAEDPTAGSITVPPPQHGTRIRINEFLPGHLDERGLQSPVHRTESIDYGIVLEERSH